jgi:hypothetical protein
MVNLSSSLPHERQRFATEICLANMSGPTSLKMVYRTALS